MILDIQTAIEDFFEPIVDTFKEVFDSISHMLSQYMSNDMITILIFGIGIALVLIIVLAFINRH